MGGLLLFAQLACKGLCGEQKGKALSGATNGSVVANPSLSARPRSKKVSRNRYLLFFYTQHKLGLWAKAYKTKDTAWRF